MESNPLLVKMCGLFGSSLANSCHIRTLTDIAHHTNLSSSSVRSSSTVNPSPSSSSSSSTHVEGPNCPPLSTFHTSSSSNPEKAQDSLRRRKPPRRKAITAMSSDTQLYYCSSKGQGQGQGRRNARNWRSGEESCYAVEKRTTDPRGEFRASMVEMIVEKRMVGAEDLERLLLSFLALNSDSYHGMILQVFSEICETLFANYEY